MVNGTGKYLPQPCERPCCLACSQTVDEAETLVYHVHGYSITIGRKREKCWEALQKLKSSTLLEDDCIA